MSALGPELDPSPQPLHMPESAPAPTGPGGRGGPAGGRAARRLPRHAAAVALVGLTVVAIIAGGLAAALQPERTGGDIADRSPVPSSSASGSAGPLASRGPASSGAPIPVDATFHAIGGTAARSIARLTATHATGSIVGLDASFRLESVSDTPTAELASRLTIEPSLGLAARSDGAAIVLTPRSPLLPGVVYRFALHGATGELLDTWAFQAKQPVRIVGTLPGADEADVPVDTGIEVTFDQDGVADAASHVTIDPATPGRFETHGRTLAFVPDRPLKRSTLYTVTVSPGISVPATGEVSVSQTRFQFETGSGTPEENRQTFTFNDLVAESPTADRPVIGLWAYGGDGEHVPATLHVSVYRLGGLDAAVAAWRSLRTRPSWTLWSAKGLVDPAGLARVVDADLSLRSLEYGWFVELPERLPAGWYLVAQNSGGRPAQQVLQVTDLSAYLAVSETRTVVWANDLASGKAIVGATAKAGRDEIGRSDVRGLIVGRTPDGLVPERGATCSARCDPVVVVRAPDGRSIFLPATRSDPIADGGGSSFWDVDPAWWSLLHTDRGRYRVGDTLNVWGMARDRDSGAVPPRATLRITAEGSGTEPALASMAVATRATGAFSTSLPLAGLPAGDYLVELSVGSSTLRTAFFTVGPIAKPAYTLSASTGHRVYIQGERLTARVAAAFYEGTPVPGVPLRFDGVLEGSATTDADGSARLSGTVSASEDRSGPDTRSVEISPARPEEGEISGTSADVYVFPSSQIVDSTARIAAGRVRAAGSVHVVARGRLERAIANGDQFWSLDPRGAAAPNAAVQVRFTELIPVRKQTGTRYDFIEKKVVPVYEIDVVRRAAGTLTVRTDAKGHWTASVPASASDHDYTVTVTVVDPHNRVSRADAYAARRTDVPDLFTTDPSLRLTDGDPDGSRRFRVGDAVDVTMIDPGLAQTPTDRTRYLFFTAQRGIHDVTAQTSRRYRLEYPSWGVPTLTIGAVRFTGRRYVGTAWYEPSFRVSDRHLQVELTTDAPRYAPGGTATVRVRTTVAGSPVSATVVLRAVDEKLYTIGAAADDDPLAELYTWVPNGIVATYGSHDVPRGQFEGGDTTGGGGDGRDDFRDSLLFRTITTDSSGRGEVTFALSDDLTSWRVTASGITRRLQAGVGTVDVPVGLPFFVDASIAAEYLAADRPTIAVRTFGSALRSGQAVEIQVTSASLGFDSRPVASTAFATVDVPLPVLRAGVQTVTISASTGSGSTRRTDRMTRTFVVSASRLTTLRTAAVDLPTTRPFAGGAAGFTTLVVSDAAAGRYDELLEALAAGGGARLDRALAADIARSILDERAGGSAEPGGSTFEIERYAALDGGLSLVPYASSDLELSTLAALVAPDRAGGPRRVEYFSRIQADPKETRERRYLALVGLAALGQPVLPAVGAAITTSDLTIREQLVLGIGAATAGDAAHARAILAALVSAHGEAAGELARLRVGSTTADITEATALAAVLAAKLGDPLAPAFWAYTAANPARDRVEALTGIGFAVAMLDHLAAGSSSFAWTLGGDRHTVELGRGEALRLVLTPEQLRSIAIEPLTGTLRVTTSWREPLATTALPVDPDMTITRTARPGTSMKATDLAIVELTVTFGAEAAAGCREVTEVVPSGLAPVGEMARWYDPDNGDPAPDQTLILPYAQDGQRVSFCVAPSERHRTFTLRYVARVVTTGRYAWEPAIAQDPSGDGPAAVTKASSITIG